MNLIARNQLDTFQVARAQVQVLLGLADILRNQQRGLADIQFVERLTKRLRLRLAKLEAIDDNQFAVSELCCQRRAQRTQQLLARELIVVGAGLRSVDRAAMPPERRADRTDASAARTLLSPELLAGAAHQLLVLGGVRAGTLPGAVVLHRFPEQILVDCAENFIGQLEGAYFLAAQIHYINRCHILLNCQWPVASSQLKVVLPNQRSAPTTGDRRLATDYFFLPAARLEAFSGSTAPPASLNPRRSLGGFFAFVIRT